MIQGLDIVPTQALPIIPTPEDIGRRIARHVFADELRSLGREVGPAPDDVTHAVRVRNFLLVSPEFFEQIRSAYGQT